MTTPNRLFQDEPDYLARSPSPFLLPAKDLSFFRLAEIFIPQEQQRRPLSSIFSLMRKRDAHWLMVDNAVDNLPAFRELYPAVHDEIAYLGECYPGVAVTVRQLTFFGSDVLWPPEGINASRHCRDKTQATELVNEVLATCVLLSLTIEKEGKDSQHDYVFEAVLALPTTVYRVDKETRPVRVPMLNNYIHVCAEANIVVGGFRVSMTGVYFTQQSGLVSSCAHSCLKIAMWHAQEHDLHQPSTRVINQVVREERGRDADFSEGLSRRELIAVCKHFGLEVLFVDYKENRPGERLHDLHQRISPYELVYLLVESGIPTIIAFKSRAGSDAPYHLVPVIGHTMNTDDWFLLAASRYLDIPLMPLNALDGSTREFLSSAEWASHLVMHDDLLGPYLCLGPNSLTRKVIVGDSNVGRAEMVFGVLPKGLRPQDSPVLAQWVGWNYFCSIWHKVADRACDPWRSRAKKRWDVPPTERARSLVLRTQCVGPAQYLENLEVATDHWGLKAKLTSGDRDRIENRLKGERYVWIVEFTLPELFCANRSKLGEVVFAQDDASDDSLIALRPGDRIGAPLLFRFIDVLEMFEDGQVFLGFGSHVPLFRRFESTHEN